MGGSAGSGGTFAPSLLMAVVAALTASFTGAVTAVVAVSAFLVQLLLALGAVAIASDVQRASPDAANANAVQISAANINKIQIAFFIVFLPRFNNMTVR
jgi:uncharacterized membrane protein YqgA involved in biofilm formation